MISEQEPLQLFDVQTAAQILSVSPWTLRRWVSEKRISFVKLGGKSVRFRRKDLAALIRSSAEEAKAVYPLRSVKEVPDEAES